MNSKQPKGSLAIQTLAMPRDTNPNGDMFGGWLVSQMDLAGGIITKQRSKGRVVTIAIDSMEFKRPVRVGDLVCCYADLTKVGTTSMTVNIEAWAISHVSGEMIQVTEGVFTYVAIDENGKPRVVDS